MKYKFCRIRINLTKCDVAFATKGGFPLSASPNANKKDTVAHNI